MAKNIHLASVL